MALTIWELALKLHQTCKSLSACLALWLSLHFEVELFLIHSPVVSVNTTYHENYTTSQTSYPNLLCVWCEASENHQKDSSLLQKWGQIQTLTALPVKCRNGTSGTPFLPTLVFYTCFFCLTEDLITLGTTPHVVKANQASSPSTFWLVQGDYSQLKHTLSSSQCNVSVANPRARLTKWAEMCHSRAKQTRPIKVIDPWEA